MKFNMTILRALYTELYYPFPSYMGFSNLVMGDL